ncbi:hypothetical protein DSO57_1034937 [Entomophthora muscae]|uniref:Uncharacterized protein n=1 Tax=Entomophthora muscae TaxID=34485 RepID=A0ACC2UA31_9FUNG|nr:hypothetical protein DSO57_1034937 [Entomophthora muscae]
MKKSAEEYTSMFLSSLIVMGCLIILVNTSTIQRRDIVQQALSSAYTLAKSLVLDYQKSQEIENARFAVKIKVWFSTHPTAPNHSVNLAPTIHVQNSQENTRISTYRGLLPVGGVYHGSVDGLKSQITQLKLDFPNGSPSSISAVCFSFGPDSVMSYQEPVCLPMSLMSYCKNKYHNSDHITLRPTNSIKGPQWLDFCDQKGCSRSLLIEDAAEFIYAFQSWEEDDISTADRLCQSISLTPPTNKIPPGKFTCYSFFNEKQKHRVQLADIPDSPDFKSKLFTKDFCPIGNFQSIAWSNTLTSGDSIPTRVSHTGSSKW